MAKPGVLEKMRLEQTQDISERLARVERALEDALDLLRRLTPISGETDSEGVDDKPTSGAKAKK